MANEQEIQQITDILNWTGQENETALSPMEKDELKKKDTRCDKPHTKRQYIVNHFITYHDENGPRVIILKGPFAIYGNRFVDLSTKVFIHYAWSLYCRQSPYQAP